MSLVFALFYFAGVSTGVFLGMIFENGRNVVPLVAENSDLKRRITETLP